MMQEKAIRSLCGFCHTNCGIKVHVQDGRVSRIEGDPDHPINKGYLCPKAQALLKPMLESADRLKFPRKKTKGGFARVSWDEALDLAADRLTKIRTDVRTGNACQLSRRPCHVWGKGRVPAIYGRLWLSQPYREPPIYALSRGAGLPGCFRRKTRARL